MLVHSFLFFLFNVITNPRGTFINELNEAEAKISELNTKLLRQSEQFEREKQDLNAKLEAEAQQNSDLRKLSPASFPAKNVITGATSLWTAKICSTQTGRSFVKYRETRSA